MFRARLNLIHNSSSHTGLSMRGYIIQLDTPIWTSPSRTRWAVGRLTRSHSSRRGSSLPLLPLQLHLQLHLELEAKRSQHYASHRGSGYSHKRSSESRQICDHVSMVSRRANNSSL